MGSEGSLFLFIQALHFHMHRKPWVVRMPTLSLLAVPLVVVMTTCGVTSNDKLGYSLFPVRIFETLLSKWYVSIAVVKRVCWCSNSPNVDTNIQEVNIRLGPYSRFVISFDQRKTYFKLPIPRHHQLRGASMGNFRHPGLVRIRAGPVWKAWEIFCHFGVHVLKDCRHVRPQESWDFTNKISLNPIL